MRRYSSCLYVSLDSEHSRVCHSIYAWNHRCAQPSSKADDLTFENQRSAPWAGLKILNSKIVCHFVKMLRQSCARIWSWKMPIYYQQGKDSRASKFGPVQNFNLPVFIDFVCKEICEYMDIFFKFIQFCLMLYVELKYYTSRPKKAPSINIFRKIILFTYLKKGYIFHSFEFE